MILSYNLSYLKKVYQEKKTDGWIKRVVDCLGNLFKNIKNLISCSTQTIPNKDLEKKKNT